MIFTFEKLTPQYCGYDVDINQISEFLLSIYPVKSFCTSDIASQTDIDRYIRIMMLYFSTHITFIFKELGYIQSDELISKKSEQDIVQQLTIYIEKDMKSKLLK